LVVLALLKHVTAGGEGRVGEVEDSNDVAVNFVCFEGERAHLMLLSPSVRCKNDTNHMTII
jgi:hypothetical protein